MILAKAKKSLTKVLFKKNYKRTDILTEVDIDVNKTLRKFKLEPDTEIGISWYKTLNGKFCLKVLPGPSNTLFTITRFTLY